MRHLLVALAFVVAVLTVRTAFGESQVMTECERVEIKCHLGIDCNLKLTKLLEMHHAN